LSCDDRVAPISHPPRPQTMKCLSAAWTETAAADRREGRIA
jgi:hypothetical protein